VWKKKEKNLIVLVQSFLTLGFMKHLNDNIFGRVVGRMGIRVTMVLFFVFCLVVPYLASGDDTTSCQEFSAQDNENFWYVLLSWR
jgi:hypothetical protein